MRYHFDDLTAEEVLVIGEGLDTIPHGRVRKLVDKIQSQITDQDKNTPSHLPPGE